MDESHEQTYEARAFVMAVAEEVDTLGRACANLQELTTAGSDFDLPADGQYVLGVSLSAPLDDNSQAALLGCSLQVRHV